MNDDILDQLERQIRIDPARRGLIATEHEFGPLLTGQLQTAAHELAHHAASVVIVTGFYIPAASPPAAETDGPLGALLLAETLRQLNVNVAVFTDELCFPALRAAALGLAFPESQLGSIRDAEAGSVPASIQPDSVTHLVSIERVGPNYTEEHFRSRNQHSSFMLHEFTGRVAREEQGRCYNMRGVCIDEWTVPLHDWFEQSQTLFPKAKTIGIGDGGNEIGMGSVSWDELARRLPEPHGGKIACRIPCEWTILAGVSNWGGYALAAAVASLRNRTDILEPWTASQQAHWLEEVVRQGPSVDGVTRLPEPTVDGLPFAAYIQPWDAMRQLLGLQR